ncbi:MAG: hypothetical protein HC905_01220 [Bacteroidales bacterium]|nr:hypothetical protein [Bacteroidales bacterium]
MRYICIYFPVIFLLTISFANAQNAEDNLKANNQYAPKWWQTNINLPESSRKVLTGKGGQLMYEFPAPISDIKLSPVAGFSTLVSFHAGEAEVWKNQELMKPIIPVVITQKEFKTVIITEEAFSVAPLLFGSYDNTINDYLGTSLSKKNLWPSRERYYYCDT